MMSAVRYQRAMAPSALDHQRAARDRRLQWQYWTTPPRTPTTSGAVATATSSSTSGSDCSAGTSPDQLADLVNSFYDGVDDAALVPSVVAAKRTDKEVLKELLVGETEDDAEAVFLVRRIRREAEAAFKAAVKVVAGRSGKQASWDWDEATTDEVAVVKRKVMWALRQRGFDAGLCKCRPDKETCRFPAGAGHDYIDVLLPDGGTTTNSVDEESSGRGRLIVELGLGSEFGIARPTERYASLLEVFPRVFVGKPEALKGVVGIMCAAAAESIKSQGMYVAPWRRREYVMSKWFGPYKRTTSRAPSSSSAASLTMGKGKEEMMKVPAAGATGGVVGSGGGVYPNGLFGCREEEWERRKALVGLAGMYL